MSDLKSKYLVLCLVLIQLVAACGTKNATPSNAEPTPTKIDPANFVSVIDNPYLPMTPGTTMIYEGKTEKGFEHNEVVVTSETKSILGVPCVVVKDTVKVDGVLEEYTTDWYTQDKHGNVWYFGEDSKEYNPDGTVAGTQGSWQAGLDGAAAGIIMKANPLVGDTYRQEYYKGHAEDWAKVLSLSESLTLPIGSYSQMLRTREWSGLDVPPVYEDKYYARGVGFVMTKGDTTGELHLIAIQK